jgi:hypothetical protein
LRPLGAEQTFYGLSLGCSARNAVQQTYLPDTREMEKKRMQGSIRLQTQFKKLTLFARHFIENSNVETAQEL